ncbi:MAG: anthranilate synthase component I family protein [Akkermansiaceae bacterium]|nr:anthranilate synthase component I family protein [Akkermansiaceae bacterium]MDP4647841.1 anthranilate synthase component I family protein [Akkermansiaceae bacterium]MDP4722053.1 anthranilate synthase component I family protein [Akkermansiaceae bacterium]MDP4779086.1 anthranilate synthase component I family protein [Akkermansiaceae bacterium]MDP4845943.1 anthranilate synthase component I family protein [Akkermansiaceae bacterium]
MKTETVGLQRIAELDGTDAVDVARRLAWLGGLVFFDTAGNVPESSGRVVSVIAARPVDTYRGNVSRRADLEVLRARLAANVCGGGDQGFPEGGLCGWVDYEGDFVFGEYQEMLIRDEESGEWWEKGGLSGKMKEPETGEVVVGDFCEEMGRGKFLESVGRVKEWIAAGDIYQVNVAQGFVAKVEGDGSLFPLYEILREVTPAPMGAWMALDGKEVLCTSPEMFLKISGRGVETRPIKGTRPRFSDPDEDRRSAVELQTSPKEVAELVMITDLLRNDLGQVCEFGSVEVTRMLQLESLAQVHHLVSTVEGTLRKGEDAVGALAACFPGGSITGAPKKRAMEIISELEGAPRGIYCGAMGWLGFNGESQFNIAIRTLVREEGTLRYQVGAGIVADSVPEDEYAETMHKGEGIRLGVGKWRARSEKTF